MTNKPKAIGTAAETAVRNVLLRAGFTEHEAHRNVLHGSEDQGDVWLRHAMRGLIVFEVKGGAAAKTASTAQIAKWMDEASIEKHNAKGQYGFLVTQKAGVGAPRAEEWYAHVQLDDLFTLIGGHGPARLPDPILRLSLGDLVSLIG